MRATISLNHVVQDLSIREEMGRQARITSEQPLALVVYFCLLATIKWLLFPGEVK
jgi:hypothetical protein